MKSWIARITIRAACIGAVLCTPAVARELRHNVAFTKVRQSPWVTGGAFEKEYHFNDLRTDFNLGLPRLSGNIVTGLADFFGVNLPLDFSVGATARASGHVALDFGYYVNGGWLDLKYPAQSTITVETVPGNDSLIRTGGPIAIQSHFRPGVSSFNISQSISAPAGGPGYGVKNLPGFDMERYSTPTFATHFPYASAWATLDYDIQARAVIEASANLIFDRYEWRKGIGFGHGDIVTLAEIDPHGLYVAGGAIDVQFFDKPFSIPNVGTVTLSYPDVAAKAVGVNAQNQLHAIERKPIIKLQGNLEKIVPLIGPFLSGEIPPFKYELLAVAGGPRLDLVQEFTFTPDPWVKMQFLEPVIRYGISGQPEAVRELEFRLGETVEYTPIVGVGELTVQTTYEMRNTFRNQTSLSVGADIDLDVVSIDTPFGKLGPIYDNQLKIDDIFKLPIYDETFPIKLSSVTTKPVTFRKSIGGSRLWEELRVIGAASVNDGEADEEGYNIWDFTFELDTDAGPKQFSKQISGISISGPGEWRIVVADEDVIAQPDSSGETLNLGRFFSMYAINTPLAFDDVVDFEFTDDNGESLYLADLHEFDATEVGVSSHPILGRNNFVHQSTFYPTVIGPTEYVPEPGSFILTLGASIHLLASYRRRARLRSSTQRCACL